MKTRNCLVRYLCAALLLALTLSAPAAAAAGYHYCVTYRCCHYCSYYDADGNFLFEIDWCWSDSGCSL